MENRDHLLLCIDEIQFHSIRSTMNSSNEKLCHKWNGFQENVSSAFGDCKKDREFADITLACEDGYQVEAHEVILPSSSPFFSDLFTLMQ